MTTMLVLGGTAWLGREVARAALDRGDSVTCLARGESGTVADGAELVRADRGRADAYDAVRSREWDAVVDVSWQPGQVRAALAALADRARHWTYVSSGSVYADHSRPDADESAALLPALDAPTATREEYGPAKVACEEAARAVLGERLLVVRSGLIAGYGDPSDRFGYWVGRFAAAAQGHPAWAGSPGVLVPDADDLASQAIDVLDLAGWIVDSAHLGTTGAFNAVGERHRFADVIEAARAVAGYAGPVVRVPSSWLADAGVAEYMGPRSLPLWLADPDWAGFSARSATAARARGLRWRPLADTLADALRWERELGLDRQRSAGLAPAQEADLLSAFSA